MNIEVLTHASIRISGDKIIYADSFKVDKDYNDADIILITHDHFDHFSPEDIAKVKKNNTVIVAPSCMEKVVKELITEEMDMVLVKPGDKLNVCDITIEVVAAYNNLKPFHMKSKGYVGYIVNVDGKRVYIAGDTDANKDNEKVKCDIALVPIGGTYTMDAKAAAKFVNVIKPELAIPTHYGSVAGGVKDENTFAQNVSDSIKVEIKMQKY